MMRWFSKINPVDIAEKDRRIEELEQEIQRYSDALSAERKKMEEFTNATRSATFSFDFNTVKAFSVERNVSGGLPCTIIGYLLPEPVSVTEGDITTKDVVREWYLYCDEKQHEEIVKSFKESRK